MNVRVPIQLMVILEARLASSERTYSGPPSSCRGARLVYKSFVKVFKPSVEQLLIVQLLNFLLLIHHVRSCLHGCPFLDLRPPTSCACHPIWHDGG